MGRLRTPGRAQPLLIRQSAPCVSLRYLESLVIARVIRAHSVHIKPESMTTWRGLADISVT